MQILKTTAKEAWSIVQNASVLALFMIFFHVPETINNYVENSQNIQKAREILHMVEEQKTSISAEKLEQIEVKGGNVV